MNQLDKDILLEISGDLEICEDFYGSISQKLGIEKEVLLGRLRYLQETNVLKRISPIIMHHKTKFTCNGMSVWKVSKDKIKETISIILEYDEISHVYEREVSDEWKYNLFAMIHATKTQEVEKIVSEISNKTNIFEYEILYTDKELKKTSPDLNYLLK